MTSLEQIAINRDLLSEDIEVVLKGIESLEGILKIRYGRRLIDRTSDVAHYERSPGIRGKVSWSLGKLAQNKVLHDVPIDILIDLLSDPDLEVRENISWTIGELTSSGIGKQEAIGPLNLLLGDKDPKVRGMAVWALGRMAERLGIAHPSTISLVSTLVNDESMFVRKGSQWTLRCINEVVQ